MWRLEIDYREQKLHNEVNNKIQQHSFDLHLKNLFIGDMQLFNPNNQLICIIERKTISDLCSSITDGRFREQKQRLLDNIPHYCKVYYLIEGNMLHYYSTHHTHKYNYNYLTQIFLRSNIKDNIHIYNSENITYSGIWLILLCRKFKQLYEEFPNLIPSINEISNDNNNNDKSDEPNKLINESNINANVTSELNELIDNKNDPISTNHSNNNVTVTPTNSTHPKNSNTSYSELLCIKKKDNLTPSIYYIYMLKQIPGISQTIAEALVNQYPSLIELINVLKDDTKLNEIIQLKIKNRKFGEKKVENLKRFLLNSN